MLTEDKTGDRLGTLALAMVAVLSIPAIVRAQNWLVLLLQRRRACGQGDASHDSLAAEDGCQSAEHGGHLA